SYPPDSRCVGGLTRPLTYIGRSGRRVLDMQFEPVVRSDLLLLATTLFLQETVGDEIGDAPGAARLRDTDGGDMRRQGPHRRALGALRVAADRLPVHFWSTM